MNLFCSEQLIGVRRKSESRVGKTIFSIMSNLKSLRQTVNDWLAQEVPVSASTFTDSTEKATTRANLIGTDNSDPAAQGVEIYTDPKNLGTAVASIMGRNQRVANFHPAYQTPEILATKFSEYINQVDKCPFLHLVKNDYVKHSFNSKDYNVLIDQVVKLYEGIASEDLNKMKDSIAEMGKSIFSQEKAEDFKNLFCETTLLLKKEGNKLLIFNTTLHMKKEHKGLFKPDIEEQEYTVNRSEYIILPELIKTHATALAALDKLNVDDWMSGSTSPEVQDKLCFKVKPFN